VADDSTRYLPKELDAAFQQNGLRVRFRVQVRKGVVTMQMWGRPVRLLEIAALHADD